MKKYFYSFLLAAFALFFQSCEKDPVSIRIPDNSGAIKDDVIPYSPTAPQYKDTVLLFIDSTQWVYNTTKKIWVSPTMTLPPKTYWVHLVRDKGIRAFPFNDARHAGKYISKLSAVSDSVFNIVLEFEPQMLWLIQSGNYMQTRPKHTDTLRIVTHI